MAIAGAGAPDGAAPKRDASLQELGKRFERGAARPRFEQEDKGQYNLQKLRARHHEIIRLHVLGFSNGEIAEALDVTPACVSYTLNGDLAQERIQVLQGQLDERAMDVRGQMQAAAPAAVEVLEEIMLDEAAKDKDRSKAARDLLDRAGFGAVKKVDVRQHVTRQDIDDIKRRAKEASHVVGDISDADFEDITDESEENKKEEGE